MTSFYQDNFCIQNIYQRVNKLKYHTCFIYIERKEEIQKAFILQEKRLEIFRRQYYKKTLGCKLKKREFRTRLYLFTKIFMNNIFILRF